MVMKSEQVRKFISELALTNDCIQKPSTLNPSLCLILYNVGWSQAPCKLHLTSDLFGSFDVTSVIKEWQW